MRRNLLVAAAVVLAVGVWWFVIRDTAPPAPDIGLAAQIAAEAQASTTSAAPAQTTAAPTTAEPTTTTAPAQTTAAPTTVAPITTAAPAQTTAAPTTVAPVTTTTVPGDATGTWTVDTSIGDYSDFTSTFVGFRVNEELGRGIGSTTAVGRTPQVAGEVELDGTVLVAAEIRADLRGLRTDRSFRDPKVQEALNTGTHPEAVFILDGPVDLGDVGTSVEVSAPGTLMVNGISQAVSVDLSADMVGEVLAVVGTLDIVFADFGVEVPSASIVIAVEDHGVVEIQVFLTR
ncbi:MAG: YceI family protein [Actinobacteria bacterium]|nr:YceI family protein [Actinomycetota bacterium]MBT4279860.1 YceI family protein [Actinomycetota bacterium]MBT6063662.1 YceI family protein [Actinomycetota bacterium]MBT6280822.1 YceI family protein [Actinomycetota bacterium]